MVSPLYSIVVTYQEYHDNIGPSPREERVGVEPAGPPLNLQLTLPVVYMTFYMTIVM